MSEHELQTLLRDAEPARAHAPDDVAGLWHDGRRRARRTRTAWSAGAAAVVAVMIGAVVTIAGGGDRTQELELVGPPPESADPAGTELPVVPEPGPDAPLGAQRPVADGFPVQLRIDRTQFVVGGDPEAEVGFLAPVEDAEAVTVAIPFTIDAWDPDTETWSPTIDLYDLSRNDRAYWQPHGTGPAWYERTKGAWGFPVSLPTQDLPPGNYRLCVQAWRSSDDPGGAGDDSATTWGDARNLPLLTVPPSAERLCVAISLLGPDVAPTAEELASAPLLEVVGLGLRTPILRANGANLSEAVGLVDGTPRPGDPGVSVIVGHRTTWKAQFQDLDQLRPGDRLAVIDGDRLVELEVVATRVVDAAGPVEAPTYGIPPAELAQPVNDDPPGVRLVTFEPKYSAAQRLIVDTVVLSPGE